MKPNLLRRVRKVPGTLWAFLFVGLMFSQAVYANEPVRVHLAIVTASNIGEDINLINDEYRDQLIELFSYSSYEQVDDVVVEIQKAVRQKVKLPDGYELILTLHEQDEERVHVHALIRKNGRQYVDTVLAIVKPGVVFLGGPPVGQEKALILVLETGF